MNEFKLYPHQQDVIDQVEAEMSFNAGETIIVRAVTSFGKSAVIAGLCKLYQNQHLIILLNIEPLIDQIAEFLDLAKVDYSILKAKRESEFDPSKNIQICFSQTYYARASKLNLKANIVIQDEIHREYHTQRTMKLLNDLKPDYRIGLTATNWDSNGFALHNSTTLHTVGAKELTEMKYIAPLKYYVPFKAQKKDYSKVKKSGNDYSISSLNEISNTEDHMNIMIDSLKQLKAKDKKILVFTNSIEQCNLATSFLVKNGYSAISYHSKNSDADNTRILDSFKHDRPFYGLNEDEQSLFNQSAEPAPIKVLCSVAKLTTGFSVNSIDIGVILSPTLVLSKFHQMLGRVQRVSTPLDTLLEKYPLKQ